MISPGIMNSQITIPTPTDWVYTGTSGTNDEVISRGVVLDRFGDPITACLTFSETDTWLTTNYPPGNYAMGYRIKVEHSAVIGGITTPCTPQYFEAQ